jgi:predicted adenine nucleotide alpha hydrolase (AANH) superfamily ATPase
VQCIESLRGEGIEPVLFWYNPNIHPFTEYRSRRDTLVQYAKTLGLTLILRDEYGLRSFIKEVSPDFDQRCAYCYRLRLEKTAACAVEEGCEAFSSTLLISPYQKHDLIRETASRLAEQSGLTFVYRDFRPLFRRGQGEARSLGLYMQKYCGCIFSEEERYQSR